MYLLLFEAWARLLGFNLSSQNFITWNGFQLGNAELGQIATWARLSAVDSVYWSQMSLQVMNALRLSHIMTHASLILIFVFVIMFFVFLFRLVSGMLSGRR